MLSELTTHGVLIWKPKDRDRRFLLLRYKTQYFQDEQGERYVYGQELLGRLSPETLELMAYAFYQYIIEFVKHDVIHLS